MDPNPNLPTHMHHMDPSVMVFFLLDDMKVGKTLPIYFPRRNPSSSPHFLLKEEADSIPFSLKKLPDLLQMFAFDKSSPQAKAMEDTLRQCELDPIKGETKVCATSLESMLDFVREILGRENRVKVLSTDHGRDRNRNKNHNHNYQLKNYTISKAPLEFSASKMVACHTVPFPYAVFFCHFHESRSRVFKVSLTDEKGDDIVDALAVCHLDTSHWSPSHVSFQLLQVEPGTSPICHFFPGDNLAWIASN